MQVGQGEGERARRAVDGRHRVAPRQRTDPLAGDLGLEAGHPHADLQSGEVQPVDHATARYRIEKRIRDRRTRWRGPASLAGSCGN